MNKKQSILALSLMISNAIMASDFGIQTEALLRSQSDSLFGITQPLNNATPTTTTPRVPNQTAANLIKLAPGLTAQIVTRKSAQSSDMLAFWPNDIAPTHIITCVEEGSRAIGTYSSGRTKLSPSVQRVELATGNVTTILRGLSGCDGIRRTPWRTIVATEEVDDGALYEILNPLTISELTVVTRGTSETVDSAGNAVVGQVEYRGALGKLAWEGLEINRQGVVYYGDEERPGSTSPGSDGGSLFKFVPTTPWAGTQVTQLTQSPLVSGNVYAYQASCQDRTSSSFPQFGQGCEIGEGAWVKVDPAQLRSSAFANGATGFYRPEDGHFDPKYRAGGVKFCWTNTGNAKAKNYGEVMCLIDTSPMGTNTTVTHANGFTYLADTTQTKGLAVAAANRIIEGNTFFNQPDNLAFQPVTGNMYVIEDNPFGDVWACLPDGRDADVKSDGCAKILTVLDSSAEPTGFTFTADGKTAYFHVQHSADSACVLGTDCANHDDFGTDDLIKITGFKIYAPLK